MNSKKCSDAMHIYIIRRNSYRWQNEFQTNVEKETHTIVWIVVATGLVADRGVRYNRYRITWQFAATIRSVIHGVYTYIHTKNVGRWQKAGKRTYVRTYVRIQELGCAVSLEADSHDFYGMSRVPATILSDINGSPVDKWAGRGRHAKRYGGGGISPSFFLDSPRSVVTACGFFKGKSRWSLPTVLLELLPFSLSFFFLLFFFWINYKLPGPPFPHVRYRFFFDKFSNFENLFRPRKSCCERDRMDRSWIRELKVLYFSNKAKQRI